MTDLAILALRFGGGAIVVMALIYAGLAWAAFKADMQVLRFSHRRQRAAMNDVALAWATSVACIAIGLIMIWMGFVVTR